MTTRGLPHQHDHDASQAKRMDRARMPKSLDGLIAWYMGRLDEEIPEQLHRHEVWRDSVTTVEGERGVRPVGGSHLGSPSYDGFFKAYLEGAPSMTDEDGYYLFPVRSALSRLHRRRPLMARYLFRLAQCGGDWRQLADALGYPHEFVDVALEETLRQLWRTTYDRTTRSGSAAA